MKQPSLLVQAAMKIRFLQLNRKHRVSLLPRWAWAAQHLYRPEFRQLQVVLGPGEVIPDTGSISI